MHLTAADLQDQIVAWVRDPILPILLIVGIALIVIRLARLFVHGLVKTLLDRETSEGTAQELSAVEVKKRMDTLEGLGTNVIRLFVFLIALLMVLGKLNLEIGPAVAGLGVVGIAVGFGTQSIVRDYFTGALILVENQFSKGDVVTIAGVSGHVEDFSLRRTTLRDLDGVVHTVPNGEIKVASNRTRVWARINLDVTVAYGTDIDKATRVVNDVGKAIAADPEWRRRVMEAPHVERIEALGEYGITLKILGLVRATEQWAAGGELRKRLLAAFATHGIEIPRPQRVVLAREPVPDPFAPGGPSSPAPTQDDLSDGTD
ncbi:MAG TPA: mechanosensitive ion channel family protein [Candidatus Limnocylindrales bacterium]|jgi:small conductance mechanosensitive channel|nr:mechanosensitive ion channel family protein [Candidatus Limnocylindrales bacterium]